MHKFAVCKIEFDPISNIQSWRSSSSFLWEFFQSSLLPMLSNLALSTCFIRALLVFVPGLLMQIPSWQFLGLIWKDPYYQLCPAQGLLWAVTNAYMSKKVNGPADWLARVKLWKAKQLQPWVLLCSPCPPTAGQVASSLGVLLFEGETFDFASSAEKVCARCLLSHQSACLLSCFLYQFFIFSSFIAS